MTDGARHIGGHRGVAGALGSIATHRLLYGMSIAMGVMLYRYYFTTDTEAALEGLTLLLVTSGLGYFAAVLVTPWATGRFHIENWVPAMLGTCGILEFMLGVTFDQVGFLIAGFILGVAGQSVKICADTIVQRDVEDAYLGRVFSVYDMLFNGMTVLGAVLASLVLPPNGKSYVALIIIAGGYLLGAVGYRLLVPRPVPKPAEVSG
jgi:hypothetical protein